MGIPYSAPAVVSLSGDTASAFAENLCVTSGDTNITAVSLGAQSAGVFDLNNREVIYAKDVFTSRSPASITKVMTALVTLELR